MRILAVAPAAHFSVHDVYVGWVEALRDLGQDVITFPFGDVLTFYDAAALEVGSGLMRKAWTGDEAKDHAVDRLCGALYKVRPELLFVTSGFFLPAQLFDLARFYGTRIVIRHTETPYEDQRQVALSEHADISLLSDWITLDAYRAVGRAYYMPHAYRPSVHCPGPALLELECDLGFVGTGYPSRVEFLEAMDLDGLDVLLAGNWRGLGEDSPLRPFLAHADEDCLDNARTVDVYRSARVGLNLYRREAETDDQVAGYSIGPREVEMAACGSFFLRDPRPESDSVFPMLPAFTCPAEASEQLRWWLAHEDQRREAAAKARAAIADRTFRNHAAQLLRWLDKE